MFRERFLAGVGQRQEERIYRRYWGKRCMAVISFWCSETEDMDPSRKREDGRSRRGEDFGHSKHCPTVGDKAILHNQPPPLVSYAS